MTNLPSLDPVPADIEDHLRRLVRAPKAPELGTWLAELIKFSGHMSTGDDMRWRLFSVVWQAMEYDTDAAWSYLQWLNMAEPTISTHLSDMLIEATDTLDAHVPLARWLHTTQDERLVTFFQDFYPIPAQRKLPGLVSRLMAQPQQPEVGIWLAAFCKGTAENNAAYIRPWRLLAAAWYAAQFDAEAGLGYLRQLIGEVETLTAADNKLLREAAEQANATAPLVQMIAAADNPTVKTLLAEFSHPDLDELAAAQLKSEPDYRALTDMAEQAPNDVALFKRIIGYLDQAGIAPKNGRLLDMACGPLAEQTLLLNSADFKTIGLGLDIPPGHLPLSGPMDWFRRRKHQQAWQEATADYYEALANEAKTSLKWKKVKINLADLTRLDEADAGYEMVICINHLHHAGNVPGLLAEAARVLKPGGAFLANIRPYSSLGGAFELDVRNPWAHLRPSVFNADAPPLPLNRWREAQFKAAIEQHFTIEQWQPENDRQVEILLTPEIQAELSEYTAEELTRKQIVVIARKK